MENIDTKKLSQEIHLSEEEVCKILKRPPPRSIDKEIISLRVKYYETENEEEKKRVGANWDKLCIDKLSEVGTSYGGMFAYFNTRPDSRARTETVKKWVFLCKNFSEARQAVIYIEEDRLKDIAFSRLLQVANNLELLKKMVELTSYRKDWLEKVVMKIATFYEV